MDWIQAVILGVVEGVTEFLPVSSTGHMIIFSRFLHLPQSEFLKTFEIAIQLGAMLAVCSQYWRIFLLDWEIGTRVLAAFFPTAIIGFVLYTAVKHYFLGNVQVVALSLLVGGVVLIVFELTYGKKPGKIIKLEDISFRQAIIIGTFQALAVVPGVSRSAATILTGLMLGINRQTIVEFSFLLAVPTIFSAVVLDVLKSCAEVSLGQWGLMAIGLMTSFIISWGTVQFLLSYIKKHDFIPFGVYRVIFALVLLYLIAKSIII